MSIQRMRKRFAVHLRYILYGIIGLFVLTLPLVFAPSPTGSRQQQPEQQGADQEVIAKVDGSSMTRGELERQFDRSVGQMLPLLEQFGQAPGADRLWRDRLDAFEQAVARHVVLQEAKRQGITVSDREVWRTADKQAQQQLDQVKLQAKGRQLDQVLAQIASATDHRARTSMSERSFRNWLAQRLHDDHGEDLREDLMLQQLQQRVVGRVSAGEQELVDSYDQTTLRTIAVSLQPPPSGTGSPGGTPKGSQPVARTDAQARKRAEELMAEARQGADFAELARTQSDDPNAKSSGGLQPATVSSRMPPEWQRALASLKEGDISDPIKAGTGYVIAKVEKRERALPKDFQKNKEKLLKQYIQQKQSQAWDSYGRELRQKAKVQVSDSELLAYQALLKGSYEQALPLLKKAAETADTLHGLAAGSVYYQLATALRLKNQWKDAADAFGKASDALSSDPNTPASARAQALLGMGQCYDNLKDYKNAAIWYQAAGDSTDAPPIHQQLLLTYQKMGRQDLVKREQQWLADNQKAEEERSKAMEQQQRKMDEQAAKKTSPGQARPGGQAPGQAPPSGGSGRRSGEVR
jgi:parvulin-like peptidyl-prolyl isomerase